MRNPRAMVKLPKDGLDVPTVKKRVLPSRGRTVARLARLLLCQNPSLYSPFHRLTQTDVETAWSNASREHREDAKACARKILRLLERWS